MRRYPDFLTWTPVLLLVLGIEFYVEENWRGAHAWALCRQELAAKGESLDPHQLAPEGKREDDLTKVPIFAELFREGYAKARLNQVGTPMLEKPINYDLLPASDTDLAQWQKYYRSAPEPWLPSQPGTPSQDVLARLSHFDPEVTEVHSALQNPDAYWPLDCEVPVPPFTMDRIRGSTWVAGTLHGISGVLELRGIAHLENGETAQAEQDFLVLQQITQSYARTPFIINGLGATALQADSEGILWEGIHRHAWNEAQLDEMEKSMASFDFLKSFREKLRFGRAGDILCLSYVENKQPIPVPYRELSEWNKMLFYTRYCPSGWLDQEKVSFCNAIQRNIEAVNLDRGMVDPASFMEDKKSVLIAPFIDNLPGFGDTTRHILRGATYSRLARLACRLEEYRLAHGQYPEKLDDLPDLPPHLNQEVLSERPFHYQRKGDGYLFYSTGWDQTDHGGTPHITVTTKDGKVQQDADWICPSP